MQVDPGSRIRPLRRESAEQWTSSGLESFREHSKRRLATGYRRQRQEANWRSERLTQMGTRFSDERRRAQSGRKRRSADIFRSGIVKTTRESRTGNENYRSHLQFTSQDAGPRRTARQAPAPRRLELGNVGCDQGGYTRRGETVGLGFVRAVLLQVLRYGLRIACEMPGFTLNCHAYSALGIGANHGTCFPP